MPKKNTIKKTAMAPTAVIAGGAGFIGSHLAETLLQKNARVIVLDNFSTGKEIFVHSLVENPNFALFDIDINAGLPKELESADYIFHLAGLEEYLYNKKEINLDSLLTNAVGTKNLLDFAKSSEGKFLLVSSIDVYQGLISPISLDNYFGTTPTEERKYSMTEAKRFAEALVWEYYTRYKTDVRIVRLPEIYGPRMNLNASGELGRLMGELLDNKNLTIFGEGTQKEYYLYITDAISGIVKSLFNANTQGKVYSLVDKDNYTPLEAAYLLKSVADRDVEILHKPRTDEINIYIKNIDTTNNSLISWEPKKNFKEGVMETLKWFGYNVNTQSFKPAQLIQNKKLEKQELISQLGETENKYMHKFFPKKSEESITSLGFDTKPKEEKTSKKPQIKGKRGKYKNAVMAFFTALATFMFVFLGIPAAQTYYHVKKAQNSLTQIQGQITQLDAAAAKDSANEAFKNLNKAQNSFKNIKWAFAVVGKKDTYNAMQNFLSSTNYATKAAYYTAKAVEPFTDVFEIIRPDSQKTLSPEQFEQATLNLNKTKENLSLATAEYKNVDTNLLPKKLDPQVTHYEELLNTANTHMEEAILLSQNANNIIGISKPTKYLILLQNSNELRPTGGFIGSYAVLELENGKIKNLTIDDVYNPDGQIDLRNIQVEPPAPIAKYLNETKMHIRNANWNPDFEESANNVEDLFYRINGDHFDGIIAIDLNMAKGLLNITGPIFLTAYDEEIDASNLYEKTQFYSEFNYENGSDQKRSFLTTLGSKLLERLFSLDKQKLPEMAKVIKENLNNKDVLIYLKDQQLQDMIKDKNWAGTLHDTDKDYLYIVDANVGGTKANYYIQMNYNYEISSLTRDGLLRATLELDYKHTGQDNAWPGGPYTNYVRVLTQEGSKLTGAKLILNDSEEDIFENVVQTTMGKYNSYEIPFTINPGEQAKIIFNYDLPQNLSMTGDNKSYSLYWQKQPGTQNDYSFKFNAPFSMKVNDQDFYTISGKLDTDKQFSLELN